MACDFADLYGYDSEDIKIMLDDDSGKYELPTMKNMVCG